SAARHARCVSSGTGEAGVGIVRGGRIFTGTSAPLSTSHVASTTSRPMPSPARATMIFMGASIIPPMTTFLTALALVLLLVTPAAAQDSPRRGGELIFVVAAEPPSFDAHQEETFAMLHPGAPQYNTLLRVDPTDRTGTKVIGDLAESWTVSPDRRTYTFKVRQGVKFHDGSVMTSKDVKASYDHIIFPPTNVVSSRKATYQAVESVEAPAPDTVVFRLKHPEASFMANLAQPWNWIYKADLLAKDPNWYKTHVMGTGPFKFVEYVRGGHWIGKKNPDYWDK